jgi:16S rRNA (cytidine1402-2'-O)-methyltransferase
MAKIFVVATPIGNLEDITHRALRILSEVDIILCEDTRMTKRLLDKYEIDTLTQSYHSHSSDEKHKKIISMLKEGKNLALVSDAGTPTISDPGVKIIDLIRKEENLEVEIISIPGPSAVTAALSVSGLPSSEFLFLGFLPHKKGRETLFKEITESKRTVVFYESPHRIIKTLDSLENALGDEREVVVARELTKIHESTLRGTAPEIKAYFEAHSDEVRGEFVVIVEGC